MSMIKKNMTPRQLIEPETFSPKTKKVLTSLFIGGVTFITALSLYSYHYGDSSFIFESTNPGITHNLLGSIGAYWASVLLYLFGCSAWLIPVILTYILRIQMFELAWKREVDRVSSLIAFVFIASASANFYGLDIYRGIYPGGICGTMLSGVLERLISGQQLELFLFMISWAAWIVIVRLSFIVHLYPIRDLFARIPLRRTVKAIRSSARYLFSRPKKEAQEVPVETSERFEQLLGEFKELQQEEVQSTPDEPVAPAVKATRRTKPTHDVNQPLTGEEGYHLPSTDLFKPMKETVSDKEIRARSKERAQALEQKLERFGIKGKIVSITQGPVVTLFEYQPDIDTKISTIIAREDDLALALQALSLRIIAPIPGRSVVGFEVAHSKRKTVLFSHLVKSKAYTGFKGALPLILGKDTLGANVVIDLASMPHLLVAGSTGSGKSVGLHAMITSLLCSRTPDEVKFILIDPKRLEFSAYTDIAHLVFPVVTDPKRAITVLKWAVEKMEDRYVMLSEAGVRNAADYNKTRSSKDEDYMPYIVIIIDELADLMMTAGKEVEYLIARLAQMARAAGIHLITATQRPSVDVITGLIKVNFPSRVAYKVTSKVDSRTILDMTGAEKLLGKGDMLFLDTKGTVQRVHGAYVTDGEINAVIKHIKAERQVEYQELTSIKKIENAADTDELFQDVIDYIKNKDEISISLLQRVFRVGYNRSARIIDQLENTGHILPADGGKMRKVAKEH